MTRPAALMECGPDALAAVHDVLATPAAPPRDGTIGVYFGTPIVLRIPLAGDYFRLLDAAGDLLHEGWL